MGFNIRDFLSPGVIGDLMRGKVDPAKILNGPFASKLSEGICQILQHFQAHHNKQTPSGGEVVAVFHQEAGEALITIVPIINGSMGQVIFETPVKKIGDVIARMEAEKRGTYHPTLPEATPGTL